MSESDGNGGRGGVKTLAIRLEPDVHAQLTLIAQLRGGTITDELKAALDAHIRAAKDAPDLAAGAQDALAVVEAEAAARRSAIAKLFGSQPTQDDEATTSGTTAPRGRTRKVGPASSS
jgi:hypothetical protein